MLRILKEVPQARNSDRHLRRIFYWQCYPGFCKEENGTMWVNPDVEEHTDPETIRRTRQKIQEHAKKMVAEGKLEWSKVLADKQIEKARAKNEERIAKAFGGNIETVL